MTQATTTDARHLERLRTCWKQHHAFPSMAKLCDVVGLSSTASGFDLVTRLKDAGYVERVEGRIAPTKRFFARPLLGSVRAGVPQPPEAEDDDFEVLTLDDYLVPDPNRTFLARLKGDSMRDAALVDGDLVVVQKNCPTKVGHRVAVVSSSSDDGAYAAGARRPVYLQATNLDCAGTFPNSEANRIFRERSVVADYSVSSCLFMRGMGRVRATFKSSMNGVVGPSELQSCC